MAEPGKNENSIPAAQAAETSPGRPEAAGLENPSRFDGNDLAYYTGLVLLGLGLAFAVSWSVALATVGGVLVVVGVTNSYVRYFLSR